MNEPKRIWLYESGKGDPVAFSEWSTALEQLLKNNSCKTLEELFDECDEWGANVEYEEGLYISIDDGGRISRIVFK